MSIRSFFQGDTAVQAIRLHLNTGTIYDHALGQYLEASDGKHYLNGGMFITNSVIGRPQMFKSTLSESLISKLLHIYPEIEVWAHDTENSIQDKERVYKLKGDLHIESDDGSLFERSELTTQDMFAMDELLEKIRQVADERIKQRNNLMVETPFEDRLTGKKMTMVTPLVMFIDSFSALISLAEEELHEKNSLSAGSIMRTYQLDGNKKAIFLRHLVNLASKAGIVLVMTGHVVDNVKIDSPLPPKKHMQHMSQNDRVATVSNKFQFYSSNMIGISNARKLIDSNKGCQYPDGNNSVNDLSRLTTNIIKCKNNISGTDINPVISQYDGILSGLTNLMYLEENKFGIGGNNVHKHCLIHPDKTFNRKKVRKMLTEDYELNRAIEILSQILFVKENWMIRDNSLLSKLTQIDNNELIELFLSKQGNVLNDILNSRGWWTFNESSKKNLRPYLGLYEIADLLLNETSVKKDSTKQQVAIVNKKAKQLNKV